MKHDPKVQLYSISVGKDRCIESSYTLEMFDSWVRALQGKSNACIQQCQLNYQKSIGDGRLNESALMDLSEI